MRSTDSRAPTNADPAERASNEKLHFRSHEKYPKARKSAIFLKCAKLHKKQGKEFKKFYTEAASKFHLPKQHLPTDKDRGARYRGMKENSKHIPNKIEQNRNNQKSSLNDLRWRGGRLPQRTWTNTREKVARITQICMLPHFKRRTHVNPENLSRELSFQGLTCSKH